MSSNDGPGMEPSERVSLCLSAALVNRVTSIVSIFFGRLAGLHNTDRFEAGQAVEVVWRKLNGHAESKALRKAFNAGMPGLRSTAEQSGSPTAKAALLALDAIDVLMSDSLAPRERVLASMHAAVAVAVEFDVLGGSPPDGHTSWISYELRGQADLMEALPPTTDEVSAATVHDLRMSSGAESMKYRNAMKELG